MTMGMVLGNGVLASAESNDGTSGTEVTGTGSTDPAIINVEIPTSFDFKVDPFNIGKNGTVYSSAMTIENKSNVPVEIQMTKLKGEVAGDEAATLASAPILADSTDKEAFLWVGPVLVTLDKSSGDITTVKPSLYDAKKYADNIVSDSESDKTISLGTLLEATYNEGSYVSTNQTRGKMYIGVNGSANTNSSTAWADDDKISVTATFNVIPKAVGTVK